MIITLYFPVNWRIQLSIQPTDNTIERTKRRPVDERTDHLQLSLTISFSLGN